MARYVFAILGSPTSDQENILKASIAEMVKEQCPDFEIEKKFLTESNLDEFEDGEVLVGAFFGDRTKTAQRVVSELVDKQFPIIPVFRDSLGFNSQIPNFLSDINGYDLDKERGGENLVGLASTMLEIVGLLSKKRKVFISYVQNQSRAVAYQLYEILLAMKFNVFLDTHSIHHGINIKDAILKHQIDSDIMILLNTSCYHKRPMTKLEYECARDRKISILRLVWPDTKVRKKNAVGKSIKLDNSDFIKGTKCLTERKIEEVILNFQKLRCRSTAAQQNWLLAQIKEQISQGNGKYCGVGQNFSLTVESESGSKRILYPRNGIPDAFDMNEILNYTSNRKFTKKPVVIYNDTNIPETLINHLQWLNKELKSIGNIDVNNLANTLNELG